MQLWMCSRNLPMDTQDQHTVTRLRSLLQLVFASRSCPSELFSWSQMAFPGCCYLSCATLTANHTFATTSNLAAKGSLQVHLQPAHKGQPVLGAVLHNSWPLQYPDLQLLRESCPWDCVIINGVPEIPTAAGSSVRALSEAHGCGQHSPTTSQESSVGLPAEPCTLPPDVHQTEAGDVAAKSMLILGLRGQDHDLERTLLNLRTLSHQLAPVMHDYRPQLIDQAQHAANTAAAVSAFASPLASTIPNSPCSPFADVEDAFSPTLPQGSSDRQERRREISGSLPLEQILSRLPSSSAAACDQHVAEEGPSQFPSRRTSRLGASLDISRLLYRAYSHLMVDADSAADLPTGQPAPVWSSGSPRGSAGGGVTRTEGYQNEGTTARLGEGMTSLLASGLGFLDSLQENLTVEHSQPPITNPTAGSRRPLGLAEPAEGSMQEAQLQAEVEARSRGQQHRQHPWLLYFYDRQTERDYGRYHAQQMAMVDAFSWTAGALTYLRVGLCNGHAYASREPVTFVLVLALHMTCLYATVFKPHRLAQVREPVLRGATLIYLAVQTFVLTPFVLESASVADVRGLASLARHSNVSTLLASSLAYMVRLHVHLPCQLLSVVISAAVLPQALCKAGFPEHSSWRCATIGASTQVVIGFVLTTIAVALNEKRLRRMYIRTAAEQRAAAMKAKIP
ncbi:hypothetical protein ABBQ32_004835 [Trebouxia sp. C0010 RCD-2024]